MATPRHLLVDPANECDYHLVSRCARAFLCGVDEHDGRDYSHRRAWLVERLRRIAPCFAVDVYAYTLLSNHFHLVLRHDPLAGLGWSDEEVARRWVEAFPPTERGEVVEGLKPERSELILDNADRVARARGINALIWIEPGGGGGATPATAPDRASSLWHCQSVPVHGTERGTIRETVGPFQARAVPRYRSIAVT